MPEVLAEAQLEPAEQTRILAAARARLAAWLERGASFERPTARERTRG